MNDYKGLSKTIIKKPSGFLTIGHIVSFNKETLTIDVSVSSGDSAVFGGHSNIKTVQLPVAYFGSAGTTSSVGFIGGYPKEGTPVILGHGGGNQWYFICFLPRDPSAKNKRGIKVPELEEGSILIQSSDRSSITLSADDSITIGEENNCVIFDTNRDITSNTFDNSYIFTEASREIDGIIFRDKNPNNNFASSLRATSLQYNDTLKPIGMDPIVNINWSNAGNSIRNPARAEKREIIYEYAKSFNVLSDDIELTSYLQNKNMTEDNIINRRDGRADALSLSLISPNYLMETIKGTVVDIYGNILDLNRFILPIGQSDNISIKNAKTNIDNNVTDNTYKNIKTLERRSIAYHFEINARKDLSGPPNVEEQNNYTRDRSRFFIDVDKEGQFKINVPASSETGNIPLLTRYENFSTISPNKKSNNPNDLVFNDKFQDIQLESFIPIDNRVVSITDNLNSNGAPIDRFLENTSDKYIKHGTAYHNISDTCITFQDSSYVEERTPTTSIKLGRVPLKQDIVSKNIIISGPNANGGGRSGSINFDGSIDLNIGANTIDRHSLWLDTQGAIIGNVGRDIKNNISMAMSFDGEVLLQSGGTTPSEDTRFKHVDNGIKPGAFDIRVINQTGEKVAIIRVDNEGVSVTTQSRIVFYSEGNMQFRSGSKIEIEAEEVNIQNRQIRKDRGLGSI